MSKIMEVAKISDTYDKFTIETLDGTQYKCTYACITEHEKEGQDVEDLTIEDDSGKMHVLYEDNINVFYEGWK